MKTNHIFRIRILSACVILFASLLVTRLYFIQIVHGEEFSERADRQYVRPNYNLFDRGSIFLQDREGRFVSGATLKIGYTLAINPSVLVDPQQAYNKISEIVDIDSETYFERAKKTEDPYEEIITQLTPDVAEKIGELSIEGISVHKDRWRFYPGDSLAAHTLGFVAFEGDALRGTYGLERYYDDVLAREGSNIYVNFFAEVFANLNKTIFQRSSVREGDIVTTLEPSVQLYLDKTVLELQDKWQSKKTAGIIMNPKNGEIYALSVTPTFDLNNFKYEDGASVFANPLTENVYEMGSIIKPLTMAAGLDSGAISPETTYNDKGYVEIEDYTISNFDGVGRGVVNMQEVLNQSLNTGAAFVEGEMGNDVFREYMEAYGIGEETGIDLPNESAGLVENLNSPRDIEYATASFGQGIAMTPIATIRALATLANGGVLVTPHVAREIKYRNGLSKIVSFNDGKRVLKEETAETITQMLVKVVDAALLGGTAKIPNYSVAAKTGTAQIAKVDERGYYDDRFLHSFFGYFPAYDPEFLLFLYTIEPQGVRYASQTLTDPFMETVRFLLNYYEVAPDR